MDSRVWLRDDVYDVVAMVQVGVVAGGGGRAAVRRGGAVFVVQMACEF